MEREKRELDGYFFRIKRDGRFVNRCFTDLTVEEQKSVLTGRSAEWLTSLCLGLAEVIKNLGDQFDIINFEIDEDEE